MLAPLTGWFFDTGSNHVAQHDLQPLHSTDTSFLSLIYTHAIHMHSKLNLLVFEVPYKQGCIYRGTNPVINHGTGAATDGTFQMCSPLGLVCQANTAQVTGKKEPQLRKCVQAGEKAQRLRAPTALPRVMSSNPSKHSGSQPFLRRSDALFRGV